MMSYAQRREQVFKVGDFVKIYGDYTHLKEYLPQNSVPPFRVSRVSVNAGGLIYYHFDDTAKPGKWPAKLLLPAETLERSDINKWFLK